MVEAVGYCFTFAKLFRKQQGLPIVFMQDEGQFALSKETQVTACELASSPAEAVAAAEKIGFPVVMTLGVDNVTRCLPCLR